MLFIKLLNSRASGGFVHWTPTRALAMDSIRDPKFSSCQLKEIAKIIKCLEPMVNNAFWPKIPILRLNFLTKRDTHNPRSSRPTTVSPSSWQGALSTMCLISCYVWNLLPSNIFLCPQFALSPNLKSWWCHCNIWNYIAGSHLDPCSNWEIFIKDECSCQH